MKLEGSYSPPPNLRRIHPGRGGISRRTTRWSAPSIAEQIRASKTPEQALDRFLEACKSAPHASAGTRRKWRAAVAEVEARRDRARLCLEEGR